MSNRHWLASYGKRIPREINPDAYPSVVHMMDAAIARHRDRIALRGFGNPMTYGEYDAKARAFAAYLQQRLGVKKGDRIAVMLPNVLAFPIAFLGIARAGAVQVNVNPLYTPRELEHQLNDAGVEMIVVFNGSTPTLAEIVGKTGVKTVITAGPGDGSAAALPSPPVDARLTARSDAVRRCADAGRAAAVHAGRAERRRPAVPAVHRRHHRPVEGRGAVAPQPGRQHRAVQGVHARRLRPGEEVIVTALPLYHIFALMVNFITLLLGRRRELAGRRTRATSTASSTR